ncbi:MAG: hypothetical protein QOG64_1643 [Acidimicrobiaceae bacterium]|nr:hypothetical protein [Acidimicrobiaceae bacterium]
MWTGLGGLARTTDALSRSISPENPTGEPGGGARWEPREGSPAARLGAGWKVRPYVNLRAGETRALAEIEGPGTITHIWCTVDQRAYRDTVLRMYWDGESSPSVECPLGDFFAVGHATRYNVVSMPVSVNPSGGFNCYWPMPFRTSCRITIENQAPEPIGGFFYQVDYELGPVPDDSVSFHAQWRRATTARDHPEHVILEGVQGRGHYVGTFLAWVQLSEGWWGEGEVKFFLDGDEDHPTICGTGTEDYFGGAWCFGDTFSGPFLGYPYTDTAGVTRHSLYRWHIPDPIRFRERLRVTVQALGWWPDGTFQPLADDIASTAYWYQSEPHSPFPPLPERQARWPR